MHTHKQKTEFGSNLGAAFLTVSAPPISPPDAYFAEDPKPSLCYCEACRKPRGEEAYYKRGEPPRDYALPFGWCRFTLRYLGGGPVGGGSWGGSRASST